VPPPLDLARRWVLVTGASSGLGAAIARRLARHHGANLLLSARRREHLEAVAREIAPAPSVVLPCDLSREGEPERLFREATAGRDVTAAVLNAGVTHFGPALELPQHGAEQIVATNVSAPLILARALHGHIAGRGAEGALLLVGSLAGMFPVPWQADYSGSKAFLNAWGQAFAHEVKGSGVSVTTFAPGGIATPMLTETDLRNVAKPGDLGIMSAERCAEYAVEAMVRRRGLVVPGFVNKLTLLLARLLPRATFLRATARIYERGLRR